MADSWFRMHLRGAVTAHAIWVFGRCEASVSELAGRTAPPPPIPCDDEETARQTAEAALLRLWPHDCAAEHCPEWIRYAGADGEIY